MPTLELETRIRAPLERCFDLARSIEFHEVTAEGSHEKAIGGRTSGLIELGEMVTWRAKHLGVWQELSVVISAFGRPAYFQDKLVRGAFASMVHDHRFIAQGEGTLMRDVFVYRSPLGPLGWIADRVVVEAHMRAFLSRRAIILKRAAESDEWRRYLPLAV